MFRRRITRLMPSEQLRDHIVQLLRSEEPLRAGDREMMAREIKRHWRSDLKRDKRIARFEKAFAIYKRIGELLHEDRTMTVAQAMQTVVAEDHGHNSVESLDKWLRRNRLS